MLPFTEPIGKTIVAVVVATKSTPKDKITQHAKYSPPGTSNIQTLATTVDCAKVVGGLVQRQNNMGKAEVVCWNGLTERCYEVERNLHHSDPLEMGF